MTLISVLYQNAFTSRILEPSPQGLISIKYLNVHYYRCFFFICWWALFPLLLLLFNPGQLGPAQARRGKLSTWIMFCETVIEAIYESWSVTLLCGCYRRKITRFDIKKVILFSCLARCACPTPCWSVLVFWNIHLWIYFKLK